MEAEGQPGLEQLLQALGDIISEGRRVNRRLDAIEDRLTSIEARLGAVDERLSNADVRQYRLEEMVSRIQPPE